MRKIEYREFEQILDLFFDEVIEVMPSFVVDRQEGQWMVMLSDNEYEKIRYILDDI